ncbi:MAG: hypothetical protein E7105_08890 [Prevotella sp.]|nr:hypothetical protein [Prevotella sp.]
MTLAYLFYWYYVVLTATTGGKIYATGDWRLPLSSEDFGDRIETRWVIAGTENRSSCYAWVRPDEGYHFAGFYDENDQLVSATDQLDEIRLWSTTDSAQEEDGIVSGINLYPVTPRRFTAVFEPDIPLQITAPKDAAKAVSTADELFDLSGRKITTPRNGQIIVRNRKKIIIK